jgi:hypothetical protein
VRPLESFRENLYQAQNTPTKGFPVLKTILVLALSLPLFSQAKESALGKCVENHMERNYGYSISTELCNLEDTELRSCIEDHMVRGYGYFMSINLCQM